MASQNALLSMDFESQDQSVNTTRLLRVAITLGFYCFQDEKNNWRIQPGESVDDWYLQQEGERWLLIVNQVPQILLRIAEALAFLQRQTDDGSDDRSARDS